MQKAEDEQSKYNLSYQTTFIYRKTDLIQVILLNKYNKSKQTNNWLGSAYRTDLTFDMAF